MTITKSKKETIRHQKVVRKTQTKNNLIFEKRTQPTKPKENKKYYNKKVNTKQDPLKNQHEIILPFLT